MFEREYDQVIYFLVLTTLVIILMFIFLMVLVLKYQKRQILHLKELNALNENLSAAILQAQLEIQEQTFQNIAREIHDNINQKLTLIKLQVSKLLLDKKDRDIDIMLSGVITDLSDLSRSMSAERLLQNGLVKSLEFEVQQLMKSGLYQVIMRTVGETFFFSLEKELIMLRIAQQCLNNILKHAKASKITISLYYKSNHLLMEIIDDGIGFTQTNNSEGIGLGSMRKRTQMLNGTLTIESEKGTGTHISIKIPYHGNEA